MRDLVHTILCLTALALITAGCWALIGRGALAVLGLIVLVGVVYSRMVPE